MRSTIAGSRTWALLCATLAGAGAVHATTTTQSETFNYSYTDFDGSSSESFPIYPGDLTATFNPADPSLGPLTSTTVTWTLSTMVDGMAGPSDDGQFSYSVSGNFYIDASQYSGTGYGSGNGGEPGSTFSASEGSGAVTSTFSPVETYIFPDFTGADPVTLTFDVTYLYGSANYIVSGDVATVASVSLIYDYAPEPGTWCLLLIGLGAVGAVVRRDRLPC